jgi:putative peptidoglycan lipid II flippase
MAYTIGLVPFVLIRSVVAPFLARGDTFTPMKAALIGTAVNVVLKVALMGSLAQVGLALATSIGAWINFALVVFWAARAGYVGADRELRSALIKMIGAGIVMALALWLAAPRVAYAASTLPRFRNETELLLLAVLGGVVYGGLVVALFGRRLRTFVRRRGTTKESVPPTEA